LGKGASSRKRPKKGGGKQGDKDVVGKTNGGKKNEKGRVKGPGGTPNKTKMGGLVLLEIVH